MLIKEQIKIARMIASGTPREVAIQEQFKGKLDSNVDVSGAVDQGGKKVKDKPKPSPHEVSKARNAIVKSKSGVLTKNPQQPVNREPVNREPKSQKIKVIRKKSTVPYKTISKDEGDGSATLKFGKNIVNKLTGRGRKSSASYDDAKLDAIYRKLKNQEKDKEPEKLQATEEFIQEVEDKKDSKAKKVIDIMRGKNSIKINPDVKENTVVVQDASGKDFVEIVDIISPQKVRSDWRKEINVTEASAAWQRKEGKSKSGGLNEKGRKSYERQNPGSDLKAPSKKVGNKRRASFCARMKGMKKKLTSAKTARDPNSRINKSLRAWNC